MYIRYAENQLKKKCLLTDSPAPKEQVIQSKRDGKARTEIEIKEPKIKVQTDEAKIMTKLEEEEVEI